MAQPQKPLLSIIIVSYNTAQLTLQAVKSAITDLKSDSALAEKSQIIVVDNNSQDKTIAQLTALKNEISQNNSRSPSPLRSPLASPSTSTSPKINILQNKKNLGFAQANNQAIKKFPAQLYLLLNSDTIIQPGALHQLVKTISQHPLDDTTAVLDSEQGKLDKLGILAATLLNKDKTIQPQGGNFPTLLTTFFQMSFLDDLPLLGRLLPSTQHSGWSFRPKAYQQDKPFQMDWVGGTAMLIRHEVIAEIGLLDSNIFMYAEDVEYCLRAKNHHWDIAIDPQAKVIHLGSASSSSSQAILGEIKGLIYIWAKHKPDWQMPLLKSIIWFGAVLRRFVFGTILRDKERAQVYKEICKQVYKKA